jgi:hypothetical protein
MKAHDADVHLCDRSGNILNKPDTVFDGQSDFRMGREVEHAS